MNNKLRSTAGVLVRSVGVSPCPVVSEAVLSSVPAVIFNIIGTAKGALRAPNAQEQKDIIDISVGTHFKKVNFCFGKHQYLPPTLCSAPSFILLLTVGSQIELSESSEKAVVRIFDSEISMIIQQQEEGWIPSIELGKILMRG